MSQLLNPPAPITLPEAPASRPDHRPLRPQPAKHDRRSRAPEPTESPSSSSGSGNEAPAGQSPPRLADKQLVEAAHEIAKRLSGLSDLDDRIAVYKEVGARFKADYRRVLNIAAARWPELIRWVNDLPEWKALLSADLS
jgi:hypothetical protein